MENIIESIHQSSSFGVIIECGSGSVISNVLYEAPGASNTIFESKQPYNKDIQIKLYGNNYDRSVSKKFIHEVLITEFNNSPKSCNFILATSFQLSDIGSTQLAHGWIGLAVSEVNSSGESTKWIKEKYYYHFSFNFKGSRQGYLKEIKKIGIDILYHYSNNTLDQFGSRFLDIFHQEFDCENDLKTNIRAGLFNIDTFDDNFITITSDGQYNQFYKVIRFEDLVRAKQGVILQKGTYNPIHKGHIEIMDQSKKQYPDYVSAFLISIDKFDKDSVQLDDLIKIVNSIISLGHNVIICKKPLFKESLDWIRERWYNLPVIFPVGIDTINRIAIAEKARILPNGQPFWYIENYIIGDAGYKNAKFLVFKRQDFELVEEIDVLEPIIVYNEEYRDHSGISSSKIRSGEIKNELDNKLKQK